MWNNNCGSLLNQGVTSLRTTGVRVTASRTLRYLRTRGVGGRVLKALDKVVQSPEWDNSYKLVSDDGTVPGRRPHATNDFSIKIPIEDLAAGGVPDGIAVIIHAYYVQTAADIIRLLRNIPSKHFLYLSTTTDADKEALDNICRDEGISDFEIRVFANRGRDIAPKLVGFNDVYAKHEFFLHLHTKKSPHSGALAGWRDYLLRHLVGSEEVVRSIFKIFETQNIGVIFPQHLPELRGILNWGYDYEAAKDILSRAGVCLTKDNILEFPSGSMFWGRSAAIRALLNLNLSFANFPEEAGQVDGTLAHAIERTFLFFAEAAGYRWVKISDGLEYPWPETVVKYDVERPEHTIQKVHRPLRQTHAGSELALARVNPELRPLTLAISGNLKPRLTLLLPSINPRSVFGGARTAIDLFKEVGKRLADFDLRVVCLDASVETEGLNFLPDFALQQEDGGRGDSDKVVVDAFNRRTGVVTVRANDYFISTAWWSEFLRREISEFQHVSFGRQTKSVYLIQDYEPNFSQWSSRWAMAESTYKFPETLIPIINSEELYEFLEARYGLKGGFYIPYSINREVGGGLQSKKKERIMLCYGRPSVTRNCFEVLLDALFVWQQSNPVLASQWEIISLGEEFPVNWTHPVQNIRVRGKVSLTEYAHLLSRASAGISLMVSPHPSYPPLEMALSGLITVSNNYDNKIIGRRSPNLIGVDQVTPSSVALAIEQAVDRAERNVGKSIPNSLIEELPCRGERYGADVIASSLRTDLV